MIGDEDSLYEDQRAKEDWFQSEREIASQAAYFGICWPSYCKNCGGWGVKFWIEYHDGPKYPGEPMQEACGACQESDGEGYPLCGRCAARLPLRDMHNNTDPCEECGWDFDDGMPEL